MIVEVRKERKLVRSRNGMFLGVLSGLGKTLSVDPLVLRLCWLISVLFFGSGILIYLFLAVLMPLEDQVISFEEPKVLGVCSKLGVHYGYEVALFRMLFVAGFFFSLGLVTAIYIGLWFFLPEKRERVYY
jgi:phage shock protein PspC (stress-responsive transcriptional regulator)